MNNKGNILIVPHGSKEYELSVELRDRILRKPLGLVFTKEQLAQENKDIHMVYMVNADVFGCLVLVATSSDEIKMRQVAVDDDFQNRGIGTTMLKFAEQYASEHNFKTIYCHARDVATPFYLKHHYRIVGDPFEEVTIKHYKMAKDLK